MPLERETELFRRDGTTSFMSEKEREAFLQPYLPKPRLEQKRAKRLQRKKPVRTFIASTIHFLLFTLIHIMFSIYARTRKYYHAITRRVLTVLYYHHRTPELIQKDVKGLSRLPQHLSIILALSGQENGMGAVETLLDNVAEVCAWCACAGIPMLSVYEKTGVLKSYIPTTHETVAMKLHSYFGARRPSLQVRAPHVPSFLNGDESGETDVMNGGQTSYLGMFYQLISLLKLIRAGHLSLLLLSSDDGRNTLVDLTKTLAEMAQHSKLSHSDISPQLIDAEISESVMGEPDLLILFAPEIKLDGYPPWQIRLTEIFHEPDNTDVEYMVWLKGLYRFARAEMRFGR